MELYKKSSGYDEAELLQLLAEGNEQAFTRLFDRYQTLVFAAAFQILKSREYAQEIVQDVFLKVWIDRSSFVEVQNPEAYIFVMARNYALKFLRKLMNERSYQFKFAKDHGRVDHTVEHQVIDKEYNHILSRTLEQLPNQQKQVYCLSRMDGLSHANIAQKMNISPWTVSNHMKSALKFIRQRLQPHIGLN